MTRFDVERGRTDVAASVSRVALRAAVAATTLGVVGCSSKAAPPVPPALVEVATVVQKDTPIYSEWVAVLDGFVNAQIQPHVGPADGNRIG